MAETRLSDYLAFLRDLTEHGFDYFLEGGQAVNFWAEFYAERVGGGGLKDFAPFTSKDCDIWGGYPLLRYLREQKRVGRLIMSSSPADGQVAIFKIPGDPERVVDILSNVFGIPAHQLDRLRERSLSIREIRVLDPLFLFQSKCCCLIGLDQAGRQDGRHVRMLCKIVPAHLAELLAQTIAGNLTERALIKELKVLQKILKVRQVKAALEVVALAPADLIPAAQLRPEHRRVVRDAFAGLMRGTSWEA
jgi:hypothetical protein